MKLLTNKLIKAKKITDCPFVEVAKDEATHISEQTGQELISDGYFKDENGKYYRFDEIEYSNHKSEYDYQIQLTNMLNINTIKNWIVFFGALIVISLAISVIYILVNLAV